MRNKLLELSILLGIFAIPITYAVSKAAKATSVAKSNVISIQEGFVKVAEDMNSTVVNVSSVQMKEYILPKYEFFFKSPTPRKSIPKSKKYQKKWISAGSGVIIHSKGYVLTNEHVIRDADNITVTLSDGSRYKGKVVNTDVSADLALIKIKSKTKFKHAKIGNSDNVKIGQWAIAIGSPFGLERTFTVGVVSARRQSISISGRKFTNLIQTDAAINRGNSGGPLYNIHGEVIGINTALYSPTGVFSGIGFAVPINSANKILNKSIKELKR